MAQRLKDAERIEKKGGDLPVMQVEQVKKGCF